MDVIIHTVILVFHVLWTIVAGFLIISNLLIVNLDSLNTKMLFTQDVAILQLVIILIDCSLRCSLICKHRNEQIYNAYQYYIAILENIEKNIEKQSNEIIKATFHNQEQNKTDNNNNNSDNNVTTNDINLNQVNVIVQANNNEILREQKSKNENEINSSENSIIKS